MDKNQIKNKNINSAMVKDTKKEVSKNLLLESELQKLLKGV